MLAAALLIAACGPVGDDAAVVDAAPPGDAPSALTVQCQQFRSQVIEPDGDILVTQRYLALADVGGLGGKFRVEKCANEPYVLYELPCGEGSTCTGETGPLAQCTVFTGGTFTADGELVVDCGALVAITPNGTNQTMTISDTRFDGTVRVIRE